MGRNAEAIIAYGHCHGESNPWEGDLDFEEKLIAVAGGTASPNPEEGFPEGLTYEEGNQWFEANREKYDVYEAEKAKIIEDVGQGCKAGEYGFLEYPEIYLVIRESEKTVCWGPTPLDPSHFVTGEDWDARLTRLYQALGIALPEDGFGWFLCASYG